jgi:hypothetical protein
MSVLPEERQSYVRFNWLTIMLKLLLATLTYIHGLKIVLYYLKSQKERTFQVPKSNGFKIICKAMMVFVVWRF